MKDNEFRVIKISKEALFEFIYESIIDNQEDFFDIKDGTKIMSHHDINFETGEYICIINNSNRNSLDLRNEIDIKKILANIADTTDSLYSPNRYIIQLTLDQLNDIQSEE